MDIVDRSTEAVGLAEGVATDSARAVTAYTARATTLDELVDGLISAFVDAGLRWRRALVPANMALESFQHFEDWERVMEPALAAIEAAIVAGQDRGIVRADLDARTTALVVRDVLDRTVKAEVLYGREGYRGTAAALVGAALRS